MKIALNRKNQFYKISSFKFCQNNDNLPPSVKKLYDNKWSVLYVTGVLTFGLNGI